MSATKLASALANPKALSSLVQHPTGALCHDCCDVLLCYERTGPPQPVEERETQLFGSRESLGWLGCERADDDAL